MDPTEPDTTTAALTLDPARPEGAETPDPRAQPWDGFVPGPENALAHAGVLALARGEAAGVSPLVVHGASGVGKSRLLHGLVDEWLLRRPGSAVAHLEAESFAALCAEAGGPKGWAELRGRFRTLDLFVLDDLHDLARAPLALAELTHTLDALAERGAGVAVSAREAPAHWRGWPRRLVSRLAGGLAVRVDPPGPASRRRFLLDRARERGVPLSAGAVDALAEAADGYRPLEGWLARVALEARLAGREADSALAAGVIATEGLGPASDPPADPAEELARVAREVAARFGLTVRELRSATRRASVTGPRHLAMYLSRLYTSASVRAIGRYYGGRDAATVRHALRISAVRVESDPSLASVLASVGRGRGGRGSGG